MGFHKLYAEVADSPDRLAKGLMFRNSIPENGGMLFKFESERELKFWGKNTFIPLDIAFVSSDMEIKRISKIAPMTIKTTCSDHKCSMAIEANDGFFKKNHIEEGDLIEIESDSLGGCCITFIKKNRGK